MALKSLEGSGEVSCVWTEQSDVMLECLDTSFELGEDMSMSRYDKGLGVSSGAPHGAWNGRNIAYLFFYMAARLRRLRTMEMVNGSALSSAVA